MHDSLRPMKIAAISLISLLMATASSWSDNGIKIEGGYVKGVPSLSKNTAVYFTLNNTTDSPIQLIKASSSAASTLELHKHIKSNGLMKMAKVDSIEVQNFLIEAAHRKQR